MCDPLLFQLLAWLVVWPTLVAASSALWFLILVVCPGLVAGWSAIYLLILLYDHPSNQPPPHMKTIRTLLSALCVLCVSAFGGWWRRTP